MKETVDFNWPNEKKGVKPEIITLPLFLLSNTINGNKLEFFFFFLAPRFLLSRHRNDGRWYADAEEGNRDRCALNTELYSSNRYATTW